MSLLLIVLGVMAFSRLTAARTAGHRSAGRVGRGDLPRRLGGGGRDARHPDPGGRAVAASRASRPSSRAASTAAPAISIEFTLARDIEAAANDVRDAVSRVADRLPEEADPPQVEKVESRRRRDPVAQHELARRWTRCSCPTTPSATSSTACRSIDGVAQVRIGGQQRYAMRIWLDRDALAARGVTVDDVESALRARERRAARPAASNRTTRDFTLRVARGYEKPEDFAQIPLRQGRGRLRRAPGRRGAGRAGLGRAPRATSAATASRTSAWASSRPPPPTAWTSPAPCAREAERIQPTLPEGTKIFVAFDTTTFIEAAVERVYHTLAEAIVLVLIVIWLFLGSVRAALIPAVTVPVCLIAAFIPLYAVRLLDQPADAAGAGAVHRPGGRRRDRGAGEHPAPRRPGRAAAGGGARAAPRRSRSR